MNTAIRDQVFTSLAGSFLQMLFSSDDQADAQKQLMMKELQLRQAAAEKQHNIEEAQRLAAICNRLEASLKLYGVPDLKLKDGGSASSGLQLKLGDGGGSRHAGISSLPGIALNDNTGNGGSTPYGIEGLPGIYTNGPGSGPAASVPADPGLSLKTGDGNPTPPPSAPGADSPPAPPASTDAIPTTDTAGGAVDPRNMTPQQLADMASKFASLPPAEQKRLMDAAANAAKDTSAGPGAAGEPQPPASGTGSQPAAEQLRQIAGSSQAATSAVTPEDAAAQARTGFDTPAAAAPMPGSAKPVVLSPSSGTPQVQPSATAPPASTAPHGSPTAARLLIHSIPPPLPAGIAAAPPDAYALAGTAPAPSNSIATPGGCPYGFEKVIPTREQLQTELAVERAQLENLQSTIMRFNRTIQLDQQQYAVWEDEATTAKKRVEDHLLSLVQDAAFNSFVDKKEVIYEDLKQEKKLTDLDKQQMNWLQRAKELKSFSEFKAWALSNQGGWEMAEEGGRQVVGLWSLSKSLPVNQELQSYIRAGEDLIDNAYDLTDLMATMDNVDRLDRNTAQYPEIVRKNGERIMPLVRNIKDIQQKLNAAPILPPGTPACVAVTPSGH